ncbi:MAG TPA: hypothetical protein VKD90_10385 [Gemmataceae bacterium]|nr:hypothetical protein [Gemmataceae bacterium]
MRLLLRMSCLVLAMVVIAGGCTSNTRSPLGERAVVKGKVSIDGKAVTNGSVGFFPVDPGRGDEQYGFIDKNGQYSAALFPGKYRVAIEPEGVRSGNAGRPSGVPAKFQKPDTSGLEAEIPSGGREGMDFILK